MTINFYRQLAQALEQGAVVLATVVQIKGSVPREVGAKMVVAADGSFGTIGGGAGEAKVIERAKIVLQTGEKQLVEIDLTGTADQKLSERETQGICGGIMQVWLERWSGAAAVALVQQILTQLQAGQSVTLVMPFTSTVPYLSPIHASPPDAFVETLHPSPLLLIVGAGHVGIQLAKVAHLIGFEIAVQDDRTEWANQQHYPQATIFTEPIAVTLAQLAAQPQLYAALVTRGYRYDLEALSTLLKRELPCCYIGMIGSQKRVQQVFQSVKQLGIPLDQLAKIHAPIGLDIGARTPEEIAVSIVAELIWIQRGGTGRPLSEQLSYMYQ
jgi:xanthine dehydrogenase accessory factor